MKNTTNKTNISFPVPVGKPARISVCVAEVESIGIFTVGLYSIELSVVSKSTFKNTELKLTCVAPLGYAISFAVVKF
ncbi:hypothetical protein [uncultured Wocania sp.]|uniref:hypothetical protein n=1 Tax=uncultured Wocania sp. TaxID=2834404 RepID=UPI0030F590E6